MGVVAVIVAGVAVDTAEEEEGDSTVETAEGVVAATTEETITIGMIAMSGTIATEAAIVAMITKPSKDEGRSITYTNTFFGKNYSNGQKIKFHCSQKKKKKNFPPPKKKKKKKKKS